MNFYNVFLSLIEPRTLFMGSVWWTSFINLTNWYPFYVLVNLLSTLIYLIARFKLLSRLLLFPKEKKTPRKPIAADLLDMFLITPLWTSKIRYQFLKEKAAWKCGQYCVHVCRSTDHLTRRLSKRSYKSLRVCVCERESESESEKVCDWEGGEGDRKSTRHSLVHSFKSRRHVAYILFPSYGRSFSNIFLQAHHFHPIICYDSKAYIFCLWNSKIIREMILKLNFSNEIHLWEIRY